MRYARELPRNARTLDLEHPLVRRATSLGANYREARHARLPKEMVSKLRLALAEGEESRYWIKLTYGSGLADPATGSELEDECHPIIKIIVAARYPLSAVG